MIIVKDIVLIYWIGILHMTKDLSLWRVISTFLASEALINFLLHSLFQIRVLGLSILLGVLHSLLNHRLLALLFIWRVAFYFSAQIIFVM
jgi:hypothetical protein